MGGQRERRAGKLHKVASLRPEAAPRGNAAAARGRERAAAGAAAVRTNLALELEAEPDALRKSRGSDVAHDRAVLLVDQHEVAEREVRVLDGHGRGRDDWLGGHAEDGTTTLRGG